MQNAFTFRMQNAFTFRMQNAFLGFPLRGG